MGETGITIVPASRATKMHSCRVIDISKRTHRFHKKELGNGTVIMESNPLIQHLDLLYYCMSKVRCGGVPKEG